MKKLTVLASLALLTACSDTSTENKKDSPAPDTVAVNDTKHPHSTVLDTVPVTTTKSVTRVSTDKLAQAIAEFTPATWNMMNTMTGDLNRDAYTDLLMIVRDDSDTTRRLLVLIGDADGNFTRAAENANVVMCKECGGVWGDPYDGLAIKNGYFSVEHYGGSSWRWTKIITFKYNEAQKTWLLHRDAGVSFHTSDPEGKEEEIVEHQEEYGKLKFADYKYN